jgi:hypothetical protein
LEGGDRLKFGDVVMAVATATVVMVLIQFLLGWILVPTMGYYWGFNVDAIISVFLAALITGYIFAGKIWESRMKAIAKITILAAFVMMFTVVMETAALGVRWDAWVQEAYTGTPPSSAFEWYAVEATFLGSQIVLNMVIVLVLGFIGLYIGSMLKRPAKS